MHLPIHLRRAVLLGVTALTALLLVTNAIVQSPGKALAASHAVSITNFAFGPASMTVSVGDTVTWTNNDPTAHTSTADNGAWDSGSIAPGASFSHTFNTAGTFSYHCTIHPFMTATITVVAAAAAPAAQPAPQAAPATTARGAAPAGQTVAAAPQLPSTGNGGLLGQQHGNSTSAAAWLLAVFAGVLVLAGGFVLYRGVLVRARR